MNQQEFDLRSIELQDWKTAQLSAIRKDTDLDMHHHNKVLNCIAQKATSMSIDEIASLSQIKELIMDGYFAREQSRRDRTTQIKHEYNDRKQQLLKEYNEWLMSRKSNREANRELWNHMHHQASDQPTSVDPTV